MSLSFVTLHIGRLATCNPVLGLNNYILNKKLKAKLSDTELQCAAFEFRASSLKGNQKVVTSASSESSGCNSNNENNHGSKECNINQKDDNNGGVDILGWDYDL